MEQLIDNNVTSATGALQGFVAEFENLSLPICSWRGEPSTLAREFGRQADFSNDGKRFVYMLRKEWSDFFIEGIHFVVLTGKEMKDYIAALEGVTYSGTPSLKYAKSLMVLLFPGIWAAISKCEARIGVAFSHLMSTVIMPRFSTGEAVSIKSIQAQGIEAEQGQVERASQMHALAQAEMRELAQAREHAREMERLKAEAHAAREKMWQARGEQEDAERELFSQQARLEQTRLEMQRERWRVDEMRRQADAVERLALSGLVSERDAKRLLVRACELAIGHDLDVQGFGHAHCIELEVEPHTPASPPPQAAPQHHPWRLASQIGSELGVSARRVGSAITRIEERGQPLRGGVSGLSVVELIQPRGKQGAVEANLYSPRAEAMILDELGRMEAEEEAQAAATFEAALDEYAEKVPDALVLRRVCEQWRDGLGASVFKKCHVKLLARALRSHGPAQVEAAVTLALQMGEAEGDTARLKRCLEGL